MGEMLRGLPPYVWLVALPQLTSRICHPHCETQRFTQHILTRVTQAFPHQARAAAPGPRALLPGSRVALQASCQVSGRLAGRPQALPLGRGQHGRAPCQVRWAASRSAARNLAALGRGSAVRSSGKGSTVATGIRHQGENSPMSHVRDSCSDKMQQQPCLHVLQLSVHPQHVRQHAVSAHAPQPAGRRGRARPQWPAEPRGRRARARRRCGRWRRCARAPCLSARTRRRRSWRPRASTTPSAATRAASACSNSLPRFPTSSSGCATTTRASDRRRRARPSPILTGPILPRCRAPRPPVPCGLQPGHLTSCLWRADRLQSAQKSLPRHKLLTQRHVDWWPACRRATWGAGSRARMPRMRAR